MEDPFDWQVTASGAVRVSRGGRGVAVIGGRDAERLLARLGRDDATDQLLLAKATGNYKRGNERR